MDTRWLDGLEESARGVLPEPVHRYFRQGARDGVTTDEAVAAWRSVRFAPRVLRDVTQVSTATTLLGTPVGSPIAVAPTTLQRAAHPEGEVAMARATASAGSLMVVSSNAGRTFAEIAATGVPWWLQAYVTADRQAMLPLLERAVAAGARAVVLTVDTPVVATKHDDGPTAFDICPSEWLRTNFDDASDEPGDPEGSRKAADLGPEDVAWLAEQTGLPVVVKGILRPDDAHACVAAGARAVWVSNHGGRQLDRCVSTAEALPGIAAAVGTDVEVYVDGGVRTGLDVLAALACGARGVFLGRAALWALTDGERTVASLHSGLRAELEESLRLAGATSPAEAPLALPGSPYNGSDLQKQ